VDIDWDKPYGEVIGVMEEVPLAKYTQDGKYYKANGVLIQKEAQPYKKDVSWAKSQTGLGGRNLLMSYARDNSIAVANDEKIGSVREKVIAHMS